MLSLAKRYLLLLYWLAITGLFLWPNPNEQQHLPAIAHIDKLAHAVVYLLLALLIMRAQKYKLQPLIWLGIAVAYGISIEAIQHLLPGRLFSLADILANCVGLILGYLLTRRSARP